MGWKLHFIEDLDKYRSEGKQIRPGDCWLAPWLIDCPDSWFATSLSPEYKRDWANKRAPLIIRLPCGSDWQPDAKFGDGHGGLKENGWMVTGEVPNITAMPSINADSHVKAWGYHGWLKNGELSDDIEGRTYEWVMPPLESEVLQFIDDFHQGNTVVIDEYTFLIDEVTEHADIIKNDNVLWSSTTGMGRWHYPAATIEDRKVIHNILKG